MRVTRLDRRHTGHEIWTHMVEPRGRITEVFEEFQAWREWCWETLGPSMERDYVKLIPNQFGILPNPQTAWCWYTEYNHLRLYFKDEAALSSFMLKWS